MFSIDPDGIYTETSLVARGGLSGPALARARRAGRLRFTRQGQRILYLGRWVLEWLESEAGPVASDRTGAPRDE